MGGRSLEYNPNEQLVENVSDVNECGSPPKENITAANGERLQNMMVEENHKLKAGVESRHV